MVEDSDVPCKGRDPSGTNELINTTHNSKLFDNRFQKYVAKSSNMHGHISPKLVDYPPAGRLVHCQQNWLKVTQYRWVLNTIQGYRIDFSSMPHQSVIPHCPQYSAEQTHLISEEVTELLQKGAIEEIYSTCKATRVEPLPCSQEGRRSTSSNQSQSPKQFCEQGTLQNGGHSYTERPLEKGGLASQNRYKRHLLFNTHSPKPQKVPQVHVQREDLPIQLTTLRHFIL